MEVPPACQVARRPGYDAASPGTRALQPPDTSIYHP